MRQDKFPFGIAGASVGEIERQVPAGEAPPLPTNDRLAVIGKSVPRINGRAKVTGAARFTVDIKLPGMLHARLLRSPQALDDLPLIIDEQDLGHRAPVG